MGEHGAGPNGRWGAFRESHFRPQDGPGRSAQAERTREAREARSPSDGRAVRCVDRWLGDYRDPPDGRPSFTFQAPTTLRAPVDPAACAMLPAGPPSGTALVLLGPQAAALPPRLADQAAEQAGVGDVRWDRELLGVALRGQ